MFPDRKYTFSRSAIESAPQDPGVILLWDRAEPIYIGRSGIKGIRQALLEHQDGKHGDCTMRATHYSWEITAYPAARETELLAEYGRLYHRDPRCNGKVA